MFDVVKGYECEILYHPGKANIVADTLNRKATSMPMKRICLRMTVITLVLEIIKQAQNEAVKKENRKRERIVGYISTFDSGLLTLHVIFGFHTLKEIDKYLWMRHTIPNFRSMQEL